jgi:DNA-binding response OmpR family regulator
MKMRYNDKKENFAFLGGFLMAVSVLIAEDDKNIAELLQMYLEKEGYAVTVAYDGGQALTKFRAIQPDLVLLDVMMPVMDGWGVCRAIRAESQTPIIMLTAKGETDDKVSGLKAGADDYITKPFEMREVLARMEAVLRRTGTATTEKAARRLVYDKLIVDMDSFELTVDGKKVDAPPKEMELLYHLAASPNRVFTRNQLLDEVWGFDYFGDSRTVDVHVKRLREKLEGVSEKWSVKTVWGVGYKFEVV